jgi:hypothetical protein
MIICNKGRLPFDTGLVGLNDVTSGYAKKGERKGETQGHLCILSRYFFPFQQVEARYSKVVGGIGTKPVLS